MNYKWNLGTTLQTIYTSLRYWLVICCNKFQLICSLFSTFYILLPYTSTNICNFIWSFCSATEEQVHKYVLVYLIVLCDLDLYVNLNFFVFYVSAQPYVDLYEKTSIICLK